jgi:ureidoacrylate peracid hydrolase
MRDGGLKRTRPTCFISDACATLTDAEQAGTLTAMAHIFCDVRDTPSMLGLIAAA